MTTPPLRTGRPALGEHDWDGWLRHLGEHPPMPSDQPLVTVRVLRPGFESPMAARNVTKVTLTEWSLDRLYEDAAVIVSELATNAIRHGLGPDPGETLRLVLIRYRNHFVCMVTDPADEPPSLQEPDHIAESGRGLHIIEAMSRAWGWAPLPGGGKAVWAALAIT
jgi:anti-sigma regulatory factor (Ser/Thr protein kinase)